MAAYEKNKLYHFVNLLCDKNFKTVHESIPSPWLDYLCVVTEQCDALLYSLPSNKSNIKPFWQCPSKVQRCLFSDDGKNLLLVLKVNSLQIYTIADKNVTLLLQIKALELINLFQTYNIDFSAASSVNPLSLKKDNMILIVNNKLLLNLEWNLIKPPIIIYSIPIALHRDIFLCEKYAFVLSSEGNLNVYHILTGQNIYYELNICTTVSSSKKSFFKVAVHTDSLIMAIVNEVEEVVLIDVKELFETKQNESKIFIETKKEKWIRSYKIPTIRQCNSKASNLFKLLGKVSPPSGLVVSHLQFSIRGLFAFYAILGQTKCCSFKVIDESSGVILYCFDNLPESTVIAGGPLPLVLTDLNLYLCLGALCSDHFIIKLCCSVVADFGLSKETELIPVSRQWEGPLNHHLAFLKIILRWQLNIFSTSFETSSLQQAEKDKSIMPASKSNFIELPISEKVCGLFKLVLECKDDGTTADSNIKELMLVNSLYHAVSLLDVLQAAPTQTLGSDIFNTLLRQILILYEKIKAVDPLRKDWIGWLDMTDEEIIREALMVGAVGLAHVFLVAKRQWQANGVESQFKVRAHAWVVELIMMNEIKKAEIALRNLGYTPLVHLKNMCLETTDPSLRDVIMNYLSELNECSFEEKNAWSFIKKIENALFSNIRRHYVFERNKMNVSATQTIKPVVCQWPTYYGSVELITLLLWPKECLDAVLTEVYFNTGDVSLEKSLKKEYCWEFLLSANQQDFLKSWIDITHNPDILHSLNKSSDYFMKNIYNLFLEWPVTTSMLDALTEAKCMESTKTFVLDACAFYGVFTNREMCSLKKIIFRLANQSLLSEIHAVLSKPTSSLSLIKFEEMVFRKCLNYSLKSVVLTCLKTPVFLTESLEIMKESLWIDIWKMFIRTNGRKLENNIFKDLIVKSLLLYKCNLKERSLLDVAVALLSGQEITNIVENEGEKCSLLRLPLIDVNWKKVSGTNEKQADITLYDLLQSSKLPVHKLYLWQSQNKVSTMPLTQDMLLEFPHFNHQVLGIKNGFKQNLDHIYYLKQGRPSFACNLFVVESLRTQRRLTTKMIKKACGLAHGLALRHWKNNSVGNACVAFIAMLGDIAAANILRIHLGVTDYISNHLSENIRFYISTLVRGIVENDFNCAQEISLILEKSVVKCFEKNESIALLKKWFLAVAFCNIHSLPLPSTLLKHLAQNQNWFSFVLCLDIFKYPYEQAIELIEEINSKVLKSHLIRAVTRTTLKLSTTSPNKSPPKILLEPENNGKEDQETVSAKDSKDIFHSFVTNIYTEVLNTIQTFTDKNIALPWSCEQDPDGDVLLTLLKCESEPDTSKLLLTSSIELQSPVLSILATCFQSENVISNMVAWLISSISTSASRMKRRDEGQQLVSRCYDPRDIETLLINLFSTGYFQTLVRGMDIFLSDNPITLFFDAVYHGVMLLNFDTALKLLKEFALELSHFPPKELSSTFSKSLVINIVVQCVGNILTRTDLPSSVKRRFLRIVAASELSAVDAGFPNYLLRSQICEILEGSDISFDSLRLYDTTLVSDGLRNCLDGLIKNFHFIQALEICSLLSLNRDECVLAMWKHQLNVSIQTETDIAKTWRDSSLAFKDENVNPNLAASFYYEIASNFMSSSRESLKNRYLALKYCLHWRRLVEDTLSASFKEESDAIELKKWKCCLHPNFDINLVKNGDSFDASQMFLNNIWSSTKVLIRCHNLEECERRRVEELINIFLDIGDLQKALRISAFFGSNHQDLILIKSCLKIAQAESCPSDIYELGALTSNTTSKKHWLQYQPAKESDLNNFESPPSREQRRILFTLDKICQSVNHGKFLAKRIFIFYRLSVNLDLTFKDIVLERDYLSVLPRFLSMQGIKKFIVASDSITLANLTPEDLAKYLKDKIVSAIMEFHSANFVTPIMLWDLSLDSDFHLITKLTDNPSLLGLELLEASSNLPCRHAVEVLIRAHACFTASCNVEGIGRVLRRARILASLALQAGQWQYLVRLLIGIGRYADMCYIFQMLKDNGQFEQLLRKGMQKVHGLHVAISEFLQRYCPQDRELGKMVAAHFGLHSKLASLWQKEAEEIISGIPVTDNILKDTSKTRQVLTWAAENYSHAVHWFLQAGKLNRALKMSHKAQLVALQISLLGGPFVLRLQSPAELQHLVNECLSVAQTLLISRAYDIEPDWVAALHERWILKGDKTFLADVKSSLILSPQLIRKYSSRFSLETTLNGKPKERMKQLLSNSKIPSPLFDDIKF